MKPNLSQIGMGKEISVGGVGRALEPCVCVCMEGENVPHWCMPWVEGL